MSTEGPAGAGELNPQQLAEAAVQKTSSGPSCTDAVQLL